MLRDIEVKEMAAVITHVAFYAGWPKAWAVFNLAKEVYKEKIEELSEKEKYQNTIFFPIGNPNDAYAQYFEGQSYLAPVSTEQIPIYNVTFEPGCKNHWHIHHAKSGGGQMLVCVGGRGFYQEEVDFPGFFEPSICLSVNHHWKLREKYQTNIWHFLIRLYYKHPVFVHN